VASGNSLTINVALTFKAGFEGGKTNYLFAQDTSGLSSGWQSRGAWTVSGVTSSQPPPQTAAPETISVSPSSGSGSTKTFTYSFSDPNGYGDLVSVQILLNQSLQANAGCYVYAARAANQLFLLNDGGSAWLGPVTAGGSGTVANSQCSINASSSSISGSGNNLTVQLAATFSSGFAGSKYNYMWAYDSSGLATGWQMKGSWTVTGGSGSTVNQAPTISGVNPSSGSGSSQSFVFAFADPNGYADIPATQMLIGPALTATGTCYVYYARSVNRVYLMNDAGNGWLGPISLGSSTSVENSQCRLNAGASSATGASSTLSVSISIDFKAGLKGAMKTYLFAQDSGGLATGWQQVGAWTVP
jgi:hypothetical protein